MPNSKETSHLKDFSRHTSELRQKAATLGHEVSELGKISKEIAQDTVGLLGENATGYYQEGMKSAKKWEQSLEEKIRKNPIQSLLIAAGIGIVLGAVWKRR